jgi:hypothetical protein
MMEQITALVVPYRKKLGQTQYLLHKELIPTWDNEMDMCGICVDGTLDKIELQILEKIKSEYGYIGEVDDINALGVCAGDRVGNKTYYLYALDLTKAKVHDASLQENTDHQFWATDQILLESIDAQMITCYARIQYLLL